MAAVAIAGPVLNGGDSSPLVWDDEDEDVGGGEDLDSRRGKSKGKGKLARRAAAGGQDRKKRPREGTDGGAGGYDLAAQEDMALALIMKRRK